MVRDKKNVFESNNYMSKSFFCFKGNPVIDLNSVFQILLLGLTHPLFRFYRSYNPVESWTRAHREGSDESIKSAQEKKEKLAQQQAELEKMDAEFQKAEAEKRAEAKRIKHEEDALLGKTGDSDEPAPAAAAADEAPAPTPPPAPPAVRPPVLMNLNKGYGIGLSKNFSQNVLMKKKFDIISQLGKSNLPKFSRTFGSKVQTI